jgi:ribonucleotide monophosphatase NagD (HAD superfamily)
LDPNLTKFLRETYPKNKFIIIGDHPKDAMLAKNLNSLFIGVLTGFHSRHQLEQARNQKSQTIIVKKIKKISVDMIKTFLYNSKQK